MSKVIWFDSTEVGAPNLSITENTMNDVLYACLVTGFNQKLVSSIAVVGGTATVACTGHSFSGLHGQRIMIEGTGTELDAKVNIQVSDANTFTYYAPSVPDGVYTGSITAKRAPLGWTREFAGTGKAIYKSGNPAANPQLLRVVDLASVSTFYANAQIIESATGIDTYTDASPTDAQMSGGARWYKYGDVDSGKAWRIYGDDRFFYLVSLLTSATTGFGLNYFGDPINYYSPDPFFKVIGGAQTSANSYTIQVNQVGIALDNGGFAHTKKTCRARDGVTKSVEHGIHAVSNTRLGSQSELGAQISSGQKIITGPTFILEAGLDKLIRGHLPGLDYPLHTTSESTAPVGPVLGDGKIYTHQRIYTDASNFGQIAIDITDTWR